MAECNDKRKVGRNIYILQVGGIQYGDWRHRSERSIDWFPIVVLLRCRRFVGRSLARGLVEALIALLDSPVFSSKPEL